MNTNHVDDCTLRNTGVAALHGFIDCLGQAPTQPEFVKVKGAFSWLTDSMVLHRRQLRDGSARDYSVSVDGLPAKGPYFKASFGTRHNHYNASTLHCTGVAALHGFIDCLGRECFLSLAVTTEACTQPGLVNAKAVNCCLIHDVVLDRKQPRDGAGRDASILVAGWASKWPSSDPSFGARQNYADANTLNSTGELFQKSKIQTFK